MSIDVTLCFSTHKYFLYLDKYKIVPNGIRNQSSSNDGVVANLVHKKYNRKFLKYGISFLFRSLYVLILSR